MSILFRPIIHGTLSYRRECELRDLVLRKPLGLSLSEADIEQEKDDLHFGGFRGDLIVCAIVTKTSYNTGKIRQMAVHPDYQGKGIGGEFFGKLCIHLRNTGFQRLWLEARKSAVGFYEKHDFIRVGAEYQKIGIPHQKMKRNFIQ